MMYFDSLVAMNEKDIAPQDTARAISIVETCSHNEADLIHVFAAALTTIRREAREAAFRDAKAALQAPTPGTMSSAQFHQGFEQMRRLGVVAIERAAANTEEGAGDG